MKSFRKMMLTAIFICAALLGMNTFVYANPQADSDEDTANITIEYRYAEGDPAPQVPQTIVRYGRQYDLIEKKAPVLESDLPVTRTYTYKLDGNISKDDLDRVANMPGIKITPVEIVMDREVDKKDVVKNLPNNDIEYLPLSKEFKVSSASKKDAVTEEELKRAGVTYDITGYDSYGLPNSYSATIVYRGLETYKEIGYYKAVATYQTDETVGSVRQYIVVATFAPAGAAAGNALTDGSDGGDAAGEGDTEALTPPVAAVNPGTDIDNPEVPMSPGTDVAEPPAVDGGNNPADIPDGGVPLGGADVTGAWSLLSALMSIASAIFCLILIASTFFGKNKRVYDEAAESSVDLKLKRNMILAVRTLAIVICLMTIVVWLLLDKFEMTMVWINQWTFVIAVFFAVNLILFALCLVKFVFSLGYDSSQGDDQPGKAA